MINKTVTLEQILLSLKKAIVKTKGGINDETLSVDTLSDDKHLIDLHGGIDELDAAELVMEIEKELNIVINDDKLDKQGIYDIQKLVTLTVSDFAEVIMSVMHGRIHKVDRLYRSSFRNGDAVKNRIINH